MFFFFGNGNRSKTELIHVLEIFSEIGVANGYDLELTNKFEGKLLFGIQSLLSGRHSVQHFDLAPNIWTEKPTQMNVSDSYQPLASRDAKNGHPHPIHYTRSIWACCWDSKRDLRERVHLEVSRANSCFDILRCLRRFYCVLRVFPATLASGTSFEEELDFSSTCGALETAWTLGLGLGRC